MIRFLFLVCVSFLSFAQQTTKVDFLKCDAFITPNAIEKSISGKIIYEFKVLQPVDTIKVDAVNMEFENVSINNKTVKFSITSKQLLLFEGFKIGKNRLEFLYKAFPKQALYFNGEGDNLQIWTQGQGKYTSHWLPSFDDVNEKVVFTISVSFNPEFLVLSNGKLIKDILLDHNKAWYYQMQKPMSSYLVMLAIGKFAKQTTKSKSGTTLAFYIDKKDSLKLEPTYRYSKQIFDFLEEEIGVKYPWGIYKQIPVRDFLYAGMENTTSTIFAQDFVVDSIGFNDRNYLNVNAHELAHQWFGDLITAKSGKHHWLQEGFATYYAMLAEKEIFGENYFYHDLYKMAKTLQAASKNDTIPILNEKASSLTFYKKGAWALHVLRTKIGEKNFRKAVKSYLKKYAFKNVDTADFLNEIKKVSDFDVDMFQKKWLESSVFQWEEAMQLLTKNDFINQLIQVENLEAIPFNEKKNALENLFKQAIYFPVQQEILYQLEAVSFEEKLFFIDKVLKSNDIKIRQTLLETTPKIPFAYKPNFENLVNDDSYITREMALYLLWYNFPEEREKYVALSSHWNGLNYNLRLAHLTLKLATFKNDITTRKEVIAEIEGYIKLPYEATVRQNAIEILLQMEVYSDTVLIALLDLSNHYKWQAVKFAKDSLRNLLNSSAIRSQLENLYTKVTPLQQERITYFLNE